ncbi:hypothetical protein CGCSCA1_v008536 [Colletotrichum siamense]|nr:hypothetical protein CGCSCA1_v008536 [Colletotrichum siamense]
MIRGRDGVRVNFAARVICSRNCKSLFLAAKSRTCSRGQRPPGHACAQCHRRGQLLRFGYFLPCLRKTASHLSITSRMVTDSCLMSTECIRRY